ncbi:MAG: hypothetical protein ACJAT5_000738 [Lentimonas sp.]|jgi:hypothetical protein
MKKIVSTIFLSVMLLFAGCASIVSKSNWPVNVSSNPEGAEFYITNSYGTKIYSGKTPTNVFLDSKKGYFKGEKYKLHFAKDGYGSLIYELNTGLNGWYIGNIVFGGLIGFLIVDPLTGAMYKLDDQVNVTLPADLSLSTENSELRIVTLDKVPENLKDQLIALQL